MNILIIKVGALGDVVRCSFLAQALYEKYKNNDPNIFWLTNKNATAFFIKNPYVHELLTLEEKNDLVGIDFDLVVNLEEDLNLVNFSVGLKSKEFIGFTLKDSKVIPTSTAKEWFDMGLLGEKPQNDILKKNSKKTHRQLMSEIVGVDYTKYEPYLRLTDYQIKLSKEFSRKNNLSERDIVVGLVLGGADRWPKQLPIDLSIKLIDEMSKNLKCKIVLFGGPNEKQRNEEIIRKSKASIINPGTENNMIDNIALMNACNYFIATDTMGLHIALALKKKTLCLIGPTPANEKDMYGLGKKIISRSRCAECMQKDCKSMEKISVPEIIKELKDLTKIPSLAIIITSYKEPKTARAIESVLNQKIDYPFKIIVSAPDKETQEIVDSYSKKDKRVVLFKDPGKGKNLAFNLLLKELKKLTYDILIFTDGDVYLEKDSINEIAGLFNDSSIGCVTGRPVPEESRESRFGYFANFLFEEANKMRKKSFLSNEFLECSGYLFAFRNKIVDSFPMDSAEDTIIPYYFWYKGYRIGYAENSKVYVKNVDNWKDWIKQKTRTSISHENLDKYVDTKITPRAKNFAKESKGAFSLVTYPKNIKEFFWSFELLVARLYMWLIVFYNKKIKKQEHSDAWERIESTK